MLIHNLSFFMDPQLPKTQGPSMQNQTESPFGTYFDQAVWKAMTEDCTPYSTQEMRKAYGQHSNYFTKLYKSPALQEAAQLEFNDKMVRQGFWWFKTPPKAMKNND